MDFKMNKEKSSPSTFQVKSLAISPAAAAKGRGGFFKAQFMLRFLGIALTTAAMITMLTSGQTVTLFFGTEFKAHYSYSSAFKFILVADAVVLGYSVLSLILVFLLKLSGPKLYSNHYFILCLHDLGATLLMMGGCGAATAIGLVGKYGMNQAGWNPMCDRVGKFCNKSTLSIALSYLVVACYSALAVISVYKLKAWATASLINSNSTSSSISQEEQSEAK